MKQKDYEKFLKEKEEFIAANAEAELKENEKFEVELWRQKEKLEADKNFYKGLSTVYCSKFEVSKKELEVSNEVTEEIRIGFNKLVGEFNESQEKLESAKHWNKLWAVACFVLCCVTVGLYSKI